MACHDFCLSQEGKEGQPRPVPAVARWSLFPSDHHAGDRAMSITDGWGVSSSKRDVCRPWGSGWWSRGKAKRRGVPRLRRRERSQDGEPSRAWLPCEARLAWSSVNQAWMPWMIARQERENSTGRMEEDPRWEPEKSHAAPAPSPLGNTACHKHESHLEAGRPHSSPRRRLWLPVLAVPEPLGGRLR